MDINDVIATETLPTSSGEVAPDWTIAAISGLENQALVRAKTGVEVACDQVRQTAAAGISILNDQANSELTWLLTLGACAQFQGCRFPRRHSMCGVVIESGRLELFRKPHRYFKWMSFAGLIFEEAMVCPLANRRGEIFGTTWMMSEIGSEMRFTERDAAIVVSAAHFTGDALSDWIESAGHRFENSRGIDTAHGAQARRRSDNV